MLARNKCLRSMLELRVSIEFSRNYTKLVMLSILYYFVVKGKLISAKSLSPVELEHQHLSIFIPVPIHLC